VISGREHASGTGPSRARQDCPPDQRRSFEQHSLRDHSAEGEAEDVDSIKAQCVEEGEHVARHVVDIVGGLPARPTDSAVVQQDHGTSGREPVDDGWVPVVHRASEVLQQDERDVAAGAESTMREARTNRLDELGGRARMRVRCRHVLSSRLRDCSACRVTCVDHCLVTSRIASANALGASCGRLCPMPPSMSRWA
jgi:hypothetical protein